MKNLSILDYTDYISRISFRFIKPHTQLPAGCPRFIQLLARLGIALEIMNTRLPYDEQHMKRSLRYICKIPKMSIFAIGAMINRGVSQMSGGQVFVNVGVWNGFTLFCGMVNNSQKKCIGIDNFSNPRAVRHGENFLKRFNKYKRPNHYFYEMNYIDYFSTIHKDPIGFYIYDGKHSYQDQLKGLQLAEPFFARNCIILIDDTNAEEPRQATMDFISNSFCRYRILLDKITYCNCHPTLWNGVMILQKLE